MADILFHGAAGEVTGSMHLLQVDGRWVALDCGLYHGRRAETDEKNRAWPVPPKDIAAVIVSHAHIDHTGRLPRLVRDGFDGPVYATPATRDLAAIMLPDSAHIQEEDVYFINKKRRKQGLPPVEPLYDYKDALGAVKAIHSIPYDRWFPVVPGLLARLNEAGHMLGSAGIELTLAKRNGHAPTIYYTGDLGRGNTPIIRDPAPLPAAEILLCESTYGNRQHESVDSSKDELVAVVKRTIDRGGKVVIPAFSVGRTQTIVYFLHEQMVAGNLQRIPVFIDSPLSVNATQVFRLHPECYDAEARAFQAVTRDILGGSCCTYIQDVDESKALNFRKEPCVIISASGMCETGRIQHHIRNNIASSRNTLLLAGYQAQNTLGRKLADGARTVLLFHEELQVHADVVQLHGFSGHADHNEILAAIKPLMASARQVYLVHGEPDQQAPLAAELRTRGLKVDIAQAGQRVAV